MSLVNRKTLLVLILFVILPVTGSRLVAQKLPKNMHYSEDSTRLQTKGLPTKGLYDENQLLSIYLEFDYPGYWDSLLINHDKGIDCKATMKVNGKSYDGVGVRFKGMTSYMMTGDSQKKSFNISVDFTHDSLDLMGYKTLNLHNGSEDPTMMREILYQHLIRNYVPTTSGCVVRLYINNEYWGVYSHIQQINSEFIKEWFLSNKGSRWRADSDNGFPMEGPGGPMGDSLFGGRPPGRSPFGGDPGKMDSIMRAGGPGRMPPMRGFGPGGPGDRDSLGGPGGPGGPGGGGGFGNGTSGLNYLGSDTSEYQKYYTLKSSKQENPWEDLVKVSDKLNNTPLENLEDSLSAYLDIDRTLWMLACENIFLDDDGYVFKGGMDYYLYFEPESGRMTTLQYDGNATMNAWHYDWSPFMNENNENYPLLNRIMKVPTLRQRYLAHVRTVIEESLDPDVVNQLVDTYASLIRNDIAEDTKKLYSTQEFEEGIPEIKEFIVKRKAFLLADEEVGKTGVAIGKVAHQTQGKDCPVDVSAIMNKTDHIGEMNLWYSTGLVGKFSKIRMYDDGKHQDNQSGDGVYGASIPVFQEKTVVRYYVEAIAGDKAGTATYSPAGAEHDVYVYNVH
ncbi:MAG: CotH kinase family protein [Bacteroidota bacterium]